MRSLDPAAPRDMKAYGGGLPSAPSNEFRRLVEAPLRRPLYVLLPPIVTLAIGLALSFLLPKRYSSSTLILVAPEKLPENFIQTVATERTTRRLQTMQQEILARTRLERVVRELDPYRTLDKEPIVRAIERMRSATVVRVKGTDAFSIEFEHPQAQMAMLVADRLTTLFMEEVVGSRERQVTDAYQFIDSELEEARQQLERKEKSLREFKERNMGSLPEQMEANLQRLQGLQLEQQVASDALRKAIDHLTLLETGVSPASASGASGPTGLSDLDQARQQLAQLRTRYTDVHPDVQALVARVGELEKAQAIKAGLAVDAGSSAANASALLAKSRLEEARAEVNNLKARLVELSKKIAAFQNRVEQTPRIEEEQRSLMRDYQKLSDNYQTLLGKRLEAQMSRKLESRWKGEQFRIVDPAFLPETPSYPNPLLFSAGGLLIGLALGLGAALLADFMDQSIKDLGDLETTFAFPVLAVIPYVSGRKVRTRRRRRFWKRRRAALAEAAAPAAPISFERPAEDSEDKPA
jgi:polysaccharide chain length determinant protein (PEP-CTERM system associated)